MFDRTHIHPTRTEYVDRDVSVTIKEKRAPTDESVKLLGEMEAAARERIVERYVATLEDNTLSAIATMEMYDTYKTRIRFTLNGKDISVDLDPIRDQPTPLVWADEAVKKISEAIAREVVSGAVRAMRVWK